MTPIYRNPITVTEENEPPEFWSAIGGKGKYASGESLKVNKLISIEVEMKHSSFNTADGNRQPST